MSSLVVVRLVHLEENLKIRSIIQEKQINRKRKRIRVPGKEHTGQAAVLSLLETKLYMRREVGTVAFEQSLYADCPSTAEAGDKGFALEH